MSNNPNTTKAYKIVERTAVLVQCSYYEVEEHPDFISEEQVQANRHFLPNRRNWSITRMLSKQMSGCVRIQRNDELLQSAGI